MTFRESLLVKSFLKDPLAVTATAWILLLLVITFVGPFIAPYPPFEMVLGPTGAPSILQPPSGLHWLGTTNAGYDVFSELVLGTRSVVVIGITAAVVVVSVGLIVGMLSGYYGGIVDTLIMRLVDMAYAVPFEPLAIVLLAILSPSEFTIILTIILLFWRQTARVIRNQVLLTRQYPYVKAAKISGASDLYVLVRHLLPQAASLGLVYMPVAFGNAILAEATIDFLGFGNPNTVSWGGILRSAFTQGFMSHALWWSLPAGFCITLTTAAVYTASRPLEEVLDPRLRGRSV